MLDPQNKLQMSERAPHIAAKCHCVSRGAQLEVMADTDWVCTLELRKAACVGFCGLYIVSVPRDLQVTGQ